MSHTAHNLDQEFWRPPVQNTGVQEGRTVTEACPRCNSELVFGARFCHVCGLQRRAEHHDARTSLLQLLDIRQIGSATGLGVASLVAFIIGLACTIAAFATGLIYSANTVLDWQAVQIWRIEWLLAAAVAMIAGILLKRSAE